MVQLTEQQIDNLTARIMRYLSNDRVHIPATKAEVRAAVVWADQFQTSIAGDFNAGLPDSIRLGASANMKQNFFSLVADAKWEES